jgi:hypothetical protein
MINPFNDRQVRDERASRECTRKNANHGNDKLLLWQASLFVFICVDSRQALISDHLLQSAANCSCR